MKLGFLLKLECSNLLLRSLRRLIVVCCVSHSVVLMFIMIIYKININYLVQLKNDENNKKIKVNI